MELDLNQELLVWAIADEIKDAIRNIYIDGNDRITSVALTVLNEIKYVIRDEKIEDDFDVVEEIVRIFEKYNISAGIRHDF